MRVALIIFSITGLLSRCYAQHDESKFFVDAGVVARTTILYREHGSGGSSINIQAPFTYQAGVNGTGVNVTPGYTFLPSVAVHYGTTLRYDFYYFKPNGNDRQNTFYVDQSLFVTKSFFDAFYIGAGYTFYNVGKTLYYTYNGYPRELRLQFNGVDLLAGVFFRRVYIEPKVSIVREHFPGTIKDHATLLSVRVYYRFHF
jgi:hypothetical protein